MCLFPKQIRNPTKRFNLNGGQPLTMFVPCGKCAECADKRKMEWKFRSFHEVRDILHHGYVVYDTLTYDDEHLPHISDFVDIDQLDCEDFSCFNNEHWRLFLKNLRRQLEYHYHITNLRYFLVSEYGMDDRFTHRPHYHIEFLLPNRSIHPCDFSRLVSRLWIYGRTDGIQYHNFDYFKENVFGYDFGDGVCNLDVLNVCGYISKYITKDSTFQPTLDKRLKHCNDAFYNDEETFKICKKCILQYHRQSQGFGLSFLNSLDSCSYRDIMDNGIVRVYDENKVVVTLPCPLYYKRKLFYKLITLDDGSKTWIPNTNGRCFLEQSKYREVEQTYNRFHQAYINLDTEHQLLIDNLLKHRNLYDLSIYHCLYHGRMRAFDYLGNIPTNKKIEGPREMLAVVISSTYSHLCPDIPYIKRDRDTDFTFCPILEHDLFGHTTTKAINHNHFIKLYEITQHSSPRFRHFDDIIHILDYVLQQHNLGKQQCRDYYDLLSKKFNVLYGKN